MRAQEIELIRSLPLFRDLSPRSIDTLAAAGFVRPVAAGVTMASEGERPSFLHLLLEGQVDLFARHQDREVTLSIVMPTAAIMLAATIIDGPCLESARTLSASTLLLIPARIVRDVYDRDNQFPRAAVRELACRYRAVVADLKNHRLRPSVERLANWILACEKRSGGKGWFRMPFEKRVLASHLGMRPENLSRGLAELAGAGVCVEGPVVRVRDAAALAAMCKPSPLIDDVCSCSLTQAER